MREALRDAAPLEKSTRLVVQQHRLVLQRELGKARDAAVGHVGHERITRDPHVRDARKRRETADLARVRNAVAAQVHLLERVQTLNATHALEAVVAEVQRADGR